jgi:D-tyrosyl-tRNA(Tyr) deacylase
VGDERVAEIARGMVVLLGVGERDRPEDGERLAAKITALRIFDDERGKMNRALAEVDGMVLAVPQFTLYADARRGRRPEFTSAAAPETAKRLFDGFCGVLRGARIDVRPGRFGASMRVSIDADGPVTIVLSTDGWPEADLGQA